MKQTRDYQPSAKILYRYADVLVNFALNSGQGVTKGQVVEVVVPDVAKPLALALQKVLLQAGAQPMIRLLPTGFDRSFYELANREQLTFFPDKYLKEKVNLIDHQIGIIADPDPYELKGVDPQKIILARDAKKPYIDWRDAKENRGNFTWTLALWGVPAKAAVVGLSYRKYWQQIIQACFLDKENPIAEWQRIFKMQSAIKDTLNELIIDKLEIKGEDVDLTVKLGPERLWNGGSGRNIPSFEFFTSPDWRGTNGWIKFNQPLYRYGNVISDVYLEFKDGIVVKAKARTGNKFLQQMIKSPNANKIGEYSLTDARMSRITHVMAETLYDENIGGPFGNTHLALGRAYKDCFRGDPAQLSTADWEKLGYNDSAEHTDIVSTTDRTVTATLQDGTELIIYQNGQFTFYQD